MVGTDDPDPDGLRRLHSDAQTLARTVGRTEDPDARFAGADPTGQVRVTVDGQGQVCDVTIEPRWRDRMTGPDLPAAGEGNPRDHAHASTGTR